MIHKNLRCHIYALIAVSIWGATFVSTKLLITAGLSPTEIFLYRFFIAYAGLLAASHHHFRSNNLKDEAMLALCGLCGGSLYFITENTALQLTYASNVSLIICTAPIITILLGHTFYKTPYKRNLLLGAFIALAGVGLVVYHGSDGMNIMPYGDLLTILAAALWACYCITLKRFTHTYSTIFITRKVFFYGLVSALLIMAATSSPLHLSLLRQPLVYGNLLYLGIGASLICYLMWNTTVGILGAEKTSNYLYIVPLVTILASVIILSEPFTILMAFGSLAIISGVYIAVKP